jgi:hypothetical protein
MKKRLFSLIGILAVVAIALIVVQQARPAPNPARLTKMAVLAPALTAGTTGGTPTFGTPTAAPALITVNTSTIVTVTVVISPAPLPNGVNLLRLGATGTQPTILGVMHDDGKNGDAVAGDGIYTLQVLFNEPATGQIRLQVSAAFKGSLKRTLSSLFQIEVRPATPNEVITRVASSLTKGDFESALPAFSDSSNTKRPSNRTILSSLPLSDLQALARFFAEATLVDEVGDTRVYRGPLMAPDGSTSYSKFIMKKNELGIWQITGW